MKKMLLLCLVLVTLLSCTAFASKSKFKDPQYNFHAIRNISLAYVSYEPYDDDRKGFKPSNNPEQQVINALKNASIKNGKNIDTYNGEAGLGDANLVVRIYKLGLQRYWREPWYEDVTETERIVVHRHGRDEVIHVPRHRTVYHPGKWVTDGYAEIEFTLKDRNDRVIYNCRDERKRDEADSYDGMVKRICNDFMKDISK